MGLLDIIANIFGAAQDARNAVHQRAYQILLEWESRPVDPRDTPNAQQAAIIRQVVLEDKADKLRNDPIFRKAYELLLIGKNPNGRYLLDGQDIDICNGLYSTGSGAWAGVKAAAKRL